MNANSLICFTAVTALIVSAHGQTAASAELARLQQQHKKDAQSALEPVNRRYADSLQSLLRRATAAGDLDTALKAKAELQALGVSVASSGSALAPNSSPAPTSTTAPVADQATLEIRLIGTKWSFPMPEKSKDEQWVQFKADGALAVGWQPDTNRKWKTTGSDTVEIRPMGNQSAVYGIQFDTLLSKATLISGDRGKIALERKK